MTKKSEKPESPSEGEGINCVTLDKGGKYPVWIRLHPSCEARSERFTDLQTRFGYAVKERIPLTTPRSRCEQCEQVLDKVKADKELDKQKRLLAIYARRRELYIQMHGHPPKDDACEPEAQEEVRAETSHAEAAETPSEDSTHGLHAKKSAGTRKRRSPAGVSA